jgi:tetratricopeptide (TPR) repeat protein
MATSLWLQLEPDSPIARQVLGRLAGTDLESTVSSFARWLAEPGRAAALFAQIPPVLARFPDKGKIDLAMRELAKPYPQMPESHYALAQVAMLVGDVKRASVEIDEALVLRAGWPKAVILKAQVLRETSPESATIYLAEFLKGHDAANDVRLVYARLLVAAKAYAPAREEMQRIDRDNLRDRIVDSEIPYLIGLISQQLEDYAEADRQFQRTLDLKPRDSNPVYFNLGAVAEARKDIDSAERWYGRVGPGEYYVGAKLKLANLMARRDGMASGRKLLHDAQESEDAGSELRTQLILAEAQLLRDGKLFDEAFELLTSALGKSPNSAELLYDRAMIADKLNRLDVLESDLQRVIELKPDYAHAYNALGYTFAERNKRLVEAQALIEKALSLAPEDPFIQDSLGWVQFRLGNLDAALATLRKAFQNRNDPEIAAHLGEVMWAAGQREEAQKLWRDALRESPGNDSLTMLLQKFRP